MSFSALALALALLASPVPQLVWVTDASSKKSSDEEITEEAARLRDLADEGVAELHAARRAATSSVNRRTNATAGPVLVDFMRAGTCAATEGVQVTPAGGLCGEGEAAPDCEPPAVAVQPLWQRERRTETAPWGPWELVNGWTCAAPDTPTEFTATDFQRLPLDPPGIRVQPATPEVLVNIPTITIADAPEQTLTTTLLGTPVEVRATATSYTWDYGDGSDPVTTTSPGHPYPNHDVHHTYDQPGTYTISLTATWTGQWRLTGTSTWLPVQGTATTSTTHTPLTAVEVRARLVAENCIENPHGPGC